MTTQILLQPIGALPDKALTTLQRVLPKQFENAKSNNISCKVYFSDSGYCINCFHSFCMIISNLKVI